MDLLKKYYAIRHDNSGRLPRLYQEVEWIGSAKYAAGDTTEVMDTGIDIGKDGIKDVIINCELSFDIDTMVAHPTIYTIRYGVGGQWTGTSCTFAINDTGILSFQNTANITYSPQQFEKVHIALDNVNKICSFNNTIGTCDIENASGSRAATLRYHLFGHKIHTNPTLRPCPSRVYSFKMYDGNTLLRDYVPCYRKSDRKIGLYDLCGSICDVTQTPFYTTLDGVFEKGSNIYK